MDTQARDETLMNSRARDAESVDSRARGVTPSTNRTDSRMEKKQVKLCVLLREKWQEFYVASNKRKNYGKLSVIHKQVIFLIPSHARTTSDRTGDSATPTLP